MLILMPYSQDLVIGSGRSGVIAVYMGRFNLTLDECQAKYEEFVRNAFVHPLGLLSIGSFMDQRLNAWRLKRICTAQIEECLPDEVRGKGKLGPVLLCPRDRSNSQPCKV